MKILIPTDFSVQAEYAYLMVKKLQEKMDAEIHFIHIMNMPDTVTMDALGNIQTCGDIDPDYVIKQKQIAERNLENLKAVYGTGLITHLRLGKLTDTIIDFSEQNKINLIVMGTKGAWGLKEKLSGTETQMVARQSKIPVLSMMCDRSDLIIKNILIVHDFKDTHSQNLSLMHNLVKAFDAKLHLLQLAKSTSESDTHSILENMKVFAKNNNISHYEPHILNDKDVENGVIHFNQMINMDIICIGTHGKGGLLHSSPTEKLINHMFKPIISFRLN